MILVAGEALIDLVVRPDGSVSAELGGGPFNVARTIARLGADVAFVGCVSHDRFGGRLFEQLRADGVRTELIQRTDAPTTLAAAELDTGGAATYRFYIAGTSAPALDRVSDSADVTEAIHVGTLGLVLEPMATTVETYLATLAKDVVVMLDPNCRPTIITDRDAYVARIDRILDRTHIVKISTDDAEYLAPNLSPVELAVRWVQRGVRAALVTAGGDETIVVTAAGQRSVAIPQIDVADTIGAGDSFGGGFLTAWTQSGRTIDDLTDLDVVANAAAAANEVAASTCTRVGADPPRRDQLDPNWGR